MGLVGAGSTVGAGEGGAGSKCQAYEPTMRAERRRGKHNGYFVPWLSRLSTGQRIRTSLIHFAAHAAQEEAPGGKVAGPTQLALDIHLHAADPYCILNSMVQYQRAHLDASFGALSDATRRGILERLGCADASITDLAERFHMTLTGMKKHVGVLEHAGLVTTEKVGRVRTCKLGLRRLAEEAAWIERYRQLWDARFDELDKIVKSMKLEERVDGQEKRK